MRLFRYVAALCLLAFAAGYLHSAWSIYQSDRAFLARERAVAVATIAHLRDMSVAERGLWLPLDEDARQIADVAFLHRQLGLAEGPTRISPAIAERVRAGLPVAVEYTMDGSQPLRFVGVTRAPVWRLLGGVVLLVVAGLLALWRD